jgi:hypothetical protein
LHTFGGGNAHSLATVSGKVYMVEKFANGGSLVQIDPNTGNVLTTILTNLNQPLGLTANPLNGHLILGTSFNGIFDVDPIAKSARLITPTPADGVTLSADGLTVYGASGGHILGFRVSDGLLVFDSGPISGVDGTALGVGTLAGKIFGNTNFGDLVEVDLLTHAQTLIATGGTRGDFVTVDTTNGSLLLTQSDRVLRLTAPPGGGFGGVVPEPSTLLGASTAIVASLLVAWRRRKHSAA